jgi:hypothetical protein
MAFWFAGNVKKPYGNPSYRVPIKEPSDKKTVVVWGQKCSDTNFRIMKGESGTECRQWFAKPKSGYRDTTPRQFKTLKEAVSWAMALKPTSINVYWTTYDEKYGDNDHARMYVLKGGRYAVFSSRTR